jgi:heme/copper-type cytochrome/quinol oxidase subunit 1
MVGWVTQLIFGVVYWMFPRYSKEQPRGNERLAWAAYWLLNVGLILRVLGEPLTGLGQTAGAPLLAASAMLQLGAGWAFVINTWGRVKER